MDARGPSPATSVSGARPPRVSVVVATRDRAQRLEALLTALREQSLPASDFELVIVDDGSRDETAALLGDERRRPEVSVRVLHGDGSGPAAARNAGWRAAVAPLIAFTDDDCEPPAGWLAALVGCADAHPDAIVQGPTQPTPRELAAEGPFTRTKRIPTPNPWYQTCNILYPRELLELLAGFDEGFPDALGEDTDLGWRAREQGAELVWCEEAEMHHAVDDLGPLGYLRTALRGADAVAVFKRFPELRSETLALGVSRNPALPRLGLAIAGLGLARRHPAAVLLALPYARHLAGRCRQRRTSLALAPYYAAYDALSAWTSLRGSLRHRTLVL